MANLKILSIIPGNRQNINSSRNFMQRQVDSLKMKSLSCEVYYFSSRFNPFKFVSNFLFIKNKYADQNINIVHSNYGTITSLFGLLVSKFINCKHIVTFHGSDINDTSSSNGYLRSKIAVVISKFVASHSHGVICVSEKLVKKLPRKIKAKILISQVGIDTAHYKFSKLKRTEIRELLNINDNEVLVLFNAGLNQPVKREDLFDKYFTNCNDKTVKVFKVGNNVTQEDMPMYMSAADALVLLSDAEGSPTIVKEALSCQLPVISLDVGDVSKLVENLQYSSIVPNASESINYLQKIIVPGLRETKGPEAVSHLSMDIKTEEIKKFMRELF